MKHLVQLDMTVIMADSTIRRGDRVRYEKWRVWDPLKPSQSVVPAVRCFECRAAFTDTTEAGQIEHRRTPCDELPTVEAIDHVRSAD